MKPGQSPLYSTTVLYDTFIVVELSLLWNISTDTYVVISAIAYFLYLVQSETVIVPVV